MTPKEKARELVDKIQEGLWRDRAVKIYQEDAVYSALIAVDEIIKHIEVSYHNKDIIKGSKLYWQEVKNEINKL